MQTVKGYFAALLAFLAMGLAMPAFADAPAAAHGVDLTPLTNAVSFSTVSALLNNRDSCCFSILILAENACHSSCAVFLRELTA